jgi:tetratricopeptide (TPR) repeat protein
MKGKDQTNSQIDLGDDLLQTRSIARAPAESDAPARASPAESSEPAREEAIDELLLNAKILIGEGLLEDAKRTLRTVMKRDPGNLGARDRLEEIQKIEIKKLLGGGDDTGARAQRRPARPSRATDLEVDETLAALEREIGSAADVEKEFFKNRQEHEAFLASMEALCATASPQDRIDLGVGFLEMGVHEVAVRLFRAAATNADLERKARGLLATALLEQAKPFDAMIEVESLIARQDSGPEEKIDYGYLAGRAQEALGHPDVAARWYRAVLQIDSQYRDAADRLKVCLRKCASTRSSSSSPSSRS